MENFGCQSDSFSPDDQRRPPPPPIIRHTFTSSVSEPTIIWITTGDFSSFSHDSKNILNDKSDEPSISPPVLRVQGSVDDEVDAILHPVDHVDCHVEWDVLGTSSTVLRQEGPDVVHTDGHNTDEEE